MIPGLQTFPEGQIIAFALIFLRIVAFVVAMPVFGTQNLPTSVKVLLAVVFSVLMFPAVKFTNIDSILISNEIIFMAAREITIGLVLGFFLRMFFYAVSIAGELIGISVGLSSAQLFNPAMGTQSNVMEQLQVLLATIFLLTMNGHHLFITGLAKSFEVLPVTNTGLNYAAFAQMGVVSQDILAIGIKMASPILISIFLANIAMGVVGRAVPQVNVFVTSMQVTMVVGIGVMIVSMPLMVGEMNAILEMVSDQFFGMMKVL